MQEVDRKVFEQIISDVVVPRKEQVKEHVQAVNGNAKLLKKHAVESHIQD